MLRRYQATSGPSDELADHTSVVDGRAARALHSPGFDVRWPIGLAQGEVYHPV